MGAYFPMGIGVYLEIHSGPAETFRTRPVAGMVRAVQPELRFDRWYLPLSVPLGLGPKNSELRVEAGDLHVKMGWAFSAAIPLASIKSAQPVETRVYSAGVHHGFGRWLVNGSFKGVVKLTIEPAARAKVWKGSATVNELWISVTDPDALIAACTAN
jgi:hypothetical protein